MTWPNSKHINSLTFRPSTQAKQFLPDFSAVQLDYVTTLLCNWSGSKINWDCRNSFAFAFVHLLSPETLKNNWGHFHSLKDLTVKMIAREISWYYDHAYFSIRILGLIRMENQALIFFVKIPQHQLGSPLGYSVLDTQFPKDWNPSWWNKQSTCLEMLRLLRISNIG